MEHWKAEGLFRQVFGEHVTVVEEEEHDGQEPERATVRLPAGGLRGHRRQGAEALREVRDVPSPVPPAPPAAPEDGFFC